MNTPPLVPARPPIRVEDGLVEVGWEGDLDAEPAYEEESARPADRPCPDDSSFNEELVEDRYAALQAWHEWTRNQGRGDTDSDPTPLESSPADEATELEAGIPNTIVHVSAVRCCRVVGRKVAREYPCRASTGFRALQPAFHPASPIARRFALLLRPKDRAIRCYRQRTSENRRMN